MRGTKSAGQPNLYFLDLSSGVVSPFLESSARESDATFSPDGRCIAYRSNESGIPQVFVRSADGDRKWQISNSDEAGQPRWSSTGHRLYLRSDKGLMVAKVGAGDNFSLLAHNFSSRASFADRTVYVSAQGQIFHDYDVGADGRLVVLPRSPESATGETRLHFVAGWLDKLQAE